MNVPKCSEMLKISRIEPGGRRDQTCGMVCGVASVFDREKCLGVILVDDDLCLGLGIYVGTYGRSTR